MANLHSGKCTSHDLKAWLPKTLHISSRTLFILSVCPSVCGWKAVDIFCLMLNLEQTSLKNNEVKRVSLSDTIDSGIPNLLQTLSIKICANSFAPICVFVRANTVILESLSTNTMIAVLPS